MLFRPCIDLHQGAVKQIVGSTLASDPGAAPVTNFVADQPPAYFARLYRSNGLKGGHVIMLDASSEDGAREALAAWPGGFQVGGGITMHNARQWLEDGAAAVIVTSFVFRNGQIDQDRLDALLRLVGRDRLVLDLSCRKRDGQYYIVTNRWQQFTTTTITPAALDRLSRCCAEFLIHAADVEGLCQGIEEELVAKLAEWSPIPTTYAGGVHNMDDVRKVREIGRGRLDITVGSALDIFGGRGVRYADMVEMNRDAGAVSPTEVEV